MLRKHDVVLFSAVPSVNSEGVAEVELNRVSEMKGVMIPVHSEMAGKPFGFDENISFRFFTKFDSEHIITGNIVRYRDNNYTIVHIADYGKVRVLYLNTLVGKTASRSITQSIRY